MGTRVLLAKQQIRNKILLKLKIQKEEERNRKSRIIEKKLFRSSCFKKAKIVMFYISFRGEVNTRDMIKKAKKSGKIVTVPVCEKNRIIKACLLGGRERLVKGPYGILEPVTKQCVNLGYLDLVIVPGLAFNKQGKRLGRGKGYYDRFLKKLPKRTATIGLAYDFQILPRIPTTSTDVNVGKIIFS